MVNYKRVLTIIMLAIAVSAAFALCASAADATVTGNGVRLRSGASTSSDILTVMPKGSAVTVGDLYDGFYAVTYNGVSGYAHSDYIAVSADAGQGDTQSAVITGNSVRFRTGPGTSYDIITTFAYGAQVSVFGQENGWYKAVFNGQTGYVFGEYVSLSAPAETAAAQVYKITGNGVRFRTGPGTSYDIITTFAYGALIDVTGLSDGWAKANYGGQAGYVSSDYIAPYSTEVSRASGDNAILLDKIVNLAKSYLGVKYVYGGASPSGFDCSGLVYYCFKEYGISLPRRGSEQYAATTHISRDDLTYGDLVFFTGPGYSTIQHVGIYLSDGQFIHSSSPGSDVKIDTINSGYYNTYYYGASRVLR